MFVCDIVWNKDGHAGMTLKELLLDNRLLGDGNLLAFFLEFLVR